MIGKKDKGRMMKKEEERKKIEEKTNAEKDVIESVMIWKLGLVLKNAFLKSAGRILIAMQMKLKIPVKIPAKKKKILVFAKKSVMINV